MARERIVFFRVSTAEAKLIEQAAKKEHLTVSAYIRRLTLLQSEGLLKEAAGG
jgi:uncharacterized protein (DUF1778 family)